MTPVRFEGLLDSTFHDAEDLIARLTPLLREPIPADDTRTPHDRECYCLVRYLLALAHTDVLDYPLMVTKGAPDPPDFRLKMPGGLVGLEQTDAGTKETHEAMDELAEGPDDMILMGKSTLVRPDGDDPPIRPLDVGFETWLEVVSEAVVRKTKRLNKPNYPPMDTDELLVYDNGYLMLHAFELKRAMKRLAQKLKTELSGEAFARIYSVVSVVRRGGDGLLFDVTGEQAVLSIE